jgi:hypothetical protein
MVSNTKSDSPSPVPPQHPAKFDWPTKGQDIPRLDWPSYVKLWSAEIDRAIGGAEGHYLGNWLLGLAIQAEQLGATSPIHQEQLATEEQDRAAAYLQALMHEAGHGGWVLIQPDPEDLSDDATGSLDGHENQPDFDESDTGPIRGWIPRDSEDETFCN